MKPTYRCLLLLGAWFLAALAVVVGVLPLPVWRLAGLVVGAVLLVDAMVLLLSRPPKAERRVDHVLALGNTASVTLDLRNEGRLTSHLLVHDDPPSAFRAQGLPVRVTVARRSHATVRYRVVPTERGECVFGRLIVWRASAAAFWQTRRREGAEESVRVYPNFQSLARYTLQAAGDRLGSIGIHKGLRRGLGSEFHQLRAYRDGDTPNQVHWKATSRRLQLISREYQDEKDQQIILLLDCGRRMRSRDGELSHFDHALNAVLLLAHIAVRQGDSVGLVTFGGMERRLAPRKGLGVPPAMLQATYDIQPTIYASDLAQALEDCAGRVRKRSLIVLVSNVSDQAPAGLIAAARAAQGRHLVLFASLREAALDAVLDGPVQELDGALRVAAAHVYRRDRLAELRRLRAAGLICLDETPARLPSALASAYFAIKAGRTL